MKTQIVRIINERTSLVFSKVVKSLIDVSRILYYNSNQKSWKWGLFSSLFVIGSTLLLTSGAPYSL